MTAPRKATSFKLSAIEQRQLAYLSLVSHHNESETVRNLIDLMASTIRSMAIQRDPDLATDPELALNGGPRLLISADEQRAWTWLVTGLEKIRDDGRTWWATPL